jgi:hypothetical protein
MPSTSKAQQRYFGMLYGKAKAGDLSSLSKDDQDKVRRMGIEKLRDYAKTKTARLPEKVAGVAIGDNMYKLSGHEYNVSKEVAESVIKLGYLSEIDHINKEAEDYIEKDAAAPAFLAGLKTIGKTMSAQGKSLFKTVAPQVKNIGKDIASGAKSMVKEVANVPLTSGTNTVARAAKQSPAPAAIKKVTRMPFAAKNTTPIAKPLKKMIKNNVPKPPSNSKWPTRLRWGLGGAAAAAAIGGSLNSNEGRQPVTRYYG